MRGLLILALTIAVVAGAPNKCALPPPRTSLNVVQNRQEANRCLLPPNTFSNVVQNPQVASLLLKENSEYYSQQCIGTIINNRAVLTVASCTEHYQPYQVRVRVGSSLANSGGVVHDVSALVNHREGVRPVCTPTPVLHRFDDIAIVRTASEIVYVDNVVQPATLSGLHLENENIGSFPYTYLDSYGFGVEKGARYTNLRDQPHRLISREECASRHIFVNDDMICTFPLIAVCSPMGNDIQDLGSPLYQDDGSVVGVAAHLDWPVIHTRVSSYIGWIKANA